MIKTLKLFIAVAFILCAFVSRSQTPGSTCAGSFSVSATTTINNISQSTKDGWFNLTAPQGITNVLIENVGTVSNKKIKRVELFSGTCAGLVLITSDSLNSPSDSTLFFSISNLATKIGSGINYYFKTIKQDSSDCITCVIDSALFNLKLSNINDPPCTTVAPTCTTGVIGANCEMVCNGSFENNIGVTFHSQLSNASGWTSPTGGTPDLFSTTASLSFMDIPCNTGFGTQPALNLGNGTNAYAGLFTGGISFSPPWAEYMQTTLNTPMQTGAFYEVSFWVSRADFQPYDNDRLDVYIEPIQWCIGLANQFPTMASIPGGPVPVYTETNTAVLNDFNNWRQIKFIYCSQNAFEQYLMIGNHLGSVGTHVPATPTVVGSCAMSPAAATPGSGFESYGDPYIYIDEVSVKEINYTLTATPNNVCPNVPINFSITGCPTPTASNYFVWNYGDGGTAVVSGSTTVHSYSLSGTYIVTVTLNAPTAIGGCPMQFTTAINILPSPTINVSASPTVICGGGSSTLTASGASTYTWTPGNILGNPIVVSPTVTTIYTVSGSSGGCVGTKTVLVIVSPNPTVTATASPTSVCSGNSSTLNASGASTYTWNPGNLVGASQVVFPTSTTTYTVIGTNTAGCSGSAVVTVSVNPSPIITINPSANPICQGSSVTMTLTGATSYTTQPGAFTTSIITATPSSTTTYTVTGSNAFGCLSTSLITITVNPVPSVTVTASSNTICSGSSTTLTATGASVYSWLPTSGLSCNLCSSPVASPTVTTTYTVTGNFGGCSNTKTITITVLPKPTITVIKSANTICQGSSVTMTLSGASTFTTNPGNLIGSPITVTPSVSTIYTITGTNSSGCTNTITTGVTVITNTVGVSSSTNQICQGVGSVTLTSASMTTYTWQPGGANTQNIVVTPSVTTTYTVFGTFTALQCPKTGTVTIIVNPTPTLVASANPTSICTGQTSTLTASGATNYTWQPGSLIGSVQVVSPSASTVYTVTGVTSGCASTQTVSINVNPSPTLVASTSSAVICSGNSTTLTASGVTTYTWNPGNIVGASVVVSPTISTTYTVQSVDPACGLQSATVFVSVISTPSVLTITSSAGPYVCNGQSTTLSTNVSNPSGFNFFWSPGGQTTPSIVITPTDNAIYAVNINGTTSCGGSGFTTICVDLVASNCCITPTTVLTWNTFTITSTSPEKSLSGKIVDVFGTVTIAANTLWGSCIFRMYSGSKIIVLPTYTLSLDGDRFFSCNDIWEGIIIQPGGSAGQVSAVNSFFEDAYKAITYDASGGAYSTNIRLNHCFFNKNYIDVDIQNCSTILSGKYLLTYNSCTYTTRPTNTSPGPNLKCSNFYSPTIVPRGIRGINMFNVPNGLVTGTTTANTGVGNYQNFFSNLDNGVYLDRSGFEVYNAKFEQMSGSNRALILNPNANVGVAIYATNPSSVTLTNTLSIHNCEFNDVWRGIAAYGMNTARTESCSFTSSVTSTGACGTNCYGNTAIIYNDAQLRTRASRNSINNFYTGILSFFSTVSTSPSFILGIGNNTLTSSSGLFGMGIQVLDGANNFNSPGYPLTIAANSITNASNGINVTNVKSGMRVSNNVITTLPYLGFPTVIQDGIVYSGCNKSAIDNNTVTGNTNLNNINGFRLIASPNVTTTCNRSHLVGNGFVYEGASTTLLRGWTNNAIGTANYGFVIRNAGIIGAQGSTVTASGNRWLGTFANARTLTDLSMGPASSATNSPLYVNNNVNQNPLFGTNLTAPPGIIGQDDYHSGPPPSIYTVTAVTFGCPAGLPTALIAPFPPMPVSPTDLQAAIDSTYNSLIDTSIIYSVNNNSTHFLHKQHAYGSLRRGEVASTQTTITNFYVTNQTSGFGLYDAIDTLINNGQLASANSSNASAPTSCNIEQNHKFINDLLIKQLGNNMHNFTTADTTQLHDLAFKCPFVYGNSVFQARALYSIIKNSYIMFYDSCDVINEGVGERKFINTENAGVEIQNITDGNSFLMFPNPNNGKMYMLYNLTTEKTAEVTITDLTGKEVYSNKISNENGRLEISLSDLKDGVYFYKIRSNEKMLKADKLVIIK